MVWGLSWRCSECNHSSMTFGWKTKKELVEELEEGIQVECSYCEKRKNLDDSNATIIKE